jgi:hypothetical protein
MNKNFFFDQQKTFKMTTNYPFKWIDIPKDELAASMPEAEGDFIR